MCLLCVVLRFDLVVCLYFVESEAWHVSLSRGLRNAETQQITYKQQQTTTTTSSTEANMLTPSEMNIFVVVCCCCMCVVTLFCCRFSFSVFCRFGHSEGSRTSLKATGKGKKKKGDETANKKRRERKETATTTHTHTLIESYRQREVESESDTVVSISFTLPHCLSSECGIAHASPPLPSTVRTAADWDITQHTHSTQPNQQQHHITSRHTATQSISHRP